MRNSLLSVATYVLVVFVVTTFAVTTGLVTPVMAADEQSATNEGADNLAPDAVKPVAVATFSGWQELIDDLNFVGDVSHSPGLGSSIEGLVALSTGGQGLVGLRRDQPWGVTVGIANNEPDVLAFVPIKDLDRMLGALAAMTGPIPKDDDGVYELETPLQTVFAKQQGEWVFIALNEPSLKNLPADPAALVTDLTKQYDAAVEVRMQNLPAEFRDVALTQIRQGLEQGMSRGAGESNTAFQARSKAAAAQVKEIEKALTEVDRLTFGWSISREDRKGYVDVMATAVPGTDTADQFASMSDGTTSFAGFESPEATVSAVCTGAVAASDQKQMPAMLASSREQFDTLFDSADTFDDPRVKEISRKFVDDMFAALEKMMDTNKFDGGMAVFGEGPFTIICGCAVADGSAFENVIDDTLKKVGEEFPSYQGYQRNVAEYKDLHFHTINVPSLPDADMLKAAREVFGDDIDITIAVGEKRVFIGVGPGAIDRVKHIVDLSAEAGQVIVPPMRIRAKMSPLMDVLGSLAQQAAKRMEGELGNLRGQLGGAADDAAESDDADDDDAPDADTDDDTDDAAADGIGSLFGGKGPSGLGVRGLGPLPLPTTMPDLSQLFVEMEAGKDNVELTVTAIPNGVRYHIVADEELLKLIWATANMISQEAMKAGPGGPFGPGGGFPQ